MKLALDTCVWGGAAATLTAAGHEVRWMGEKPPDPDDAAVLVLAFGSESLPCPLSARRMRGE